MAGLERKKPGPLLLLVSREASVWAEVLGQKGRLGDGAADSFPSHTAGKLSAQETGFQVQTRWAS